MKTIRVGFIFCYLVFSANIVHAAGPYEVGKMTIDGNTCRWTSTIRQNCTRAEMQRKMKEMENCYGPRLEKETEQCRDMPCVRQTIKRIVSDCCARTNGEMQ